jgi:hypothetical protein
MFAVVLICMRFLSCKDDLSSTNDYLVQVDSIHVQDTVISDKALNVVFFGIVGLNTCQRFKTFNINYNNNDVQIEAWGTDNSNGGVCGEGIVYLNGQQVTLNLYPAGTYRILITEPNGTTLVKQIIVK